MTSFPPVVQATVDGHRVVAVRCSNVPNRPWLTVDIGKGWTLARADGELEEKVALGPVAASSRRTESVTVTNREKVVTGGRAPVGVFEAMGLPGFSGAPDAFFTTLLKTTVEDRWCIRSAILDDGFEGTAAEVWERLVKVVDDAWTVESIEQSVDGTWRQRSLRDLLEAAGGDPL